MPKGGKKRSVPTSSSDESPPKPQGAVGPTPGSGESPKPGSSKSPDKLAVPDPSPSKLSPSKEKEIARRHLKSRSSVIKNLTKEQITEMGMRIFQKWAWLRQKCRRKSGGSSKKTKVEAEEECEDKTVPVEKTDVPEMEDLVKEEVQDLEEYRFAEEVESVKDRVFTESEDDSDEVSLREGVWERYLFRKEANKHRSALEMMVITCRDSAHMVDRLTESMSEMQLRMSAPSSPAHRPEELKTFFHDLKLTRERLNSQSSSDESFKRDKPGPSKIEKSEKKPDDSPSDDDKSTAL